MSGLSRGARRHSAGVQTPAFAKCGAVADLDGDMAAPGIQFCPERIGFVERDWVLRLIMRREHADRFTRREYATSHVALLTRMVSGAKNFFEHLGPILHRLTIYLQNDMLNDCRTDALVSEGETNRPIAAVEFKYWPHRCAHLLALHVGGVTGNTHSQ